MKIRRRFFCPFAFILFCGVLGCQSWNKFWLTDAAITSYSIPAIGATGIITGDHIAVIAPSLASLAPFTAVFNTNAETVTVNGVRQVSGSTANDFAGVVTYRLTAGDKSVREYKVRLIAPALYAGNSLRLWIRADSLALTDGTGIAAWNDESGKANHFAQATGGLQPIFRSNRINGFPVAEFAPGKQVTVAAPETSIYLDSGAFTNGSLFVVMLPKAQVSAHYFLLIGAANGRQFELNIGVLSPASVVGRNGMGYGYGSTILLPQQYTAIGILQTGTTNISEYWNGDLKGSVLPGCCSTYDWTPPGAIQLGHPAYDGEIAEVMFFNATLSATETARIFCYLNVKYALSSAVDNCSL